MYILIELLRYFLSYLLRDNYNKFHRQSMQTERTLDWVCVENLFANPGCLLGSSVPNLQKSEVDLCIQLSNDYWTLFMCQALFYMVGNNYTEQDCYPHGDYSLVVVVV